MAIAIVAMFAITSSASATIITYNAQGAGTTQTDINYDFGTVAVPPVGDMPTVLVIERLREASNLEYLQALAGTPISVSDVFYFSVDTVANGAAAFTSLILTKVTGLKDITINIWDISGGGMALVDTGYASGINPDNSHIELGLFDLAAFPAEYMIEVFATVSGTSTGQYFLNLEISAVPIPPAIALFATAIAGLMGFAGTRRKTT